MKFPVNSLLAGNLAFSETSSQLTPPSSGESTANLPHRASAGQHGKTIDKPNQVWAADIMYIVMRRGFL